MIRPFAAILLAALWAPSALAADLTLFMGGEAEYDDNAFRRESDEEDDFFFRIRPGVKIHEDRGDDVNFLLQYEVPAEFAVDNSEELNDVDHVANGDVTWHVNDRMDVSATDRFRYLRSALRRNLDEDSVESGLGVPSIAEERERVKLNDAELATTYRFAPRLFGRASASHSWFDSTREDRSEVNTAAGSGSLHYALTSEHQVGGGARFIWQEFDESSDFSGSTSQTYNIFGSWRWTIDETTALEISAGPSLIRTDQDDSDAQFVRQLVPFTVSAGGIVNQTGLVDVEGNPLAVGTPIAPGSLFLQNGTVCPNVVAGETVLPCASNVVADAASFPAVVSAIQGATTTVTNADPGGDTETDLTVFAEVVLTKRWLPTLATALRYSRRQGNASGLGGTVVTDAVSLSNTWDFLERWQLSLRGDWTYRESVSDQVGTFLRVDPSFDLGTIAPGGPYTEVAALDGTAFNAKVDSVNIETQRWGVAGRIAHRLFRNTRVYAQVTYDQQESDRGTRGATSDFDNFLVTLGVRHVFEPIKLW